MTLTIKRRAGINNPARFMMRFFKTGKFLKSSGDALLSNDLSYVTSMTDSPPTIEKISPWVFDDAVAKRFQNEAETHIPDYKRVIDSCLDIVSKNYSNKDINIIDVGSALGFTVDKFYQAGYHNIKGVEVSESMKNNSCHKDKIIISNLLPEDTYDVILANWTLHFIIDRTSYFENIFKNLNPNGIFIISDKMSQTEEVKKLYYDWKRSNGVSEETIKTKEVKLKGVLETKPLLWYIEILSKIGFKNIECINSRFNFNTLLCRKL